MDEKKSKLSEIRATAFDAVEMMRLLGNPGVVESLSKVRDTAFQINEIIHGLQTPQMVKNIENFRIISENFNDVSTKMQSTVNQLKETGVIDKTVSLVDSAKQKIDSFDGMNGADIGCVVVSTKEMFNSISGLVNEITQTIYTVKKSQTVANVSASINGVKEIYHTV
ncbi:hypothetical protein YTPLAS73_07490 [Nitrosarchaeum sp.]|nr:hypothetical protein YTPLAS73_07490 [Nitrosarchaeum sp.]